ncbi:MAG: gamma-glutamyltransferase, partial [Polaribacter sp.]|nr:gamma-glutamyltransferase [Polaribacter sp.]
MKKYFLLGILSLVLFNCEESSKKIGVISEKAMVVSARKEASQIGIDILKKGGNAYDAMIATQFALAVVYPIAGNIGGGGFMVYRNNDGTKGALDFREKAPIAASKNMYLDSLGNVIPAKSEFGALAVGIPGSVAGVFEVYKKFGTLPFKELIQPAIDLARNGFSVTKKQANSLNSSSKAFEKANSYKTAFQKEWKEGDILKQEALAKTLERIRDFGRDGFYKGKTADLLVNYVTELGGIITHEDLEKYQAIWRKPIEFSY